MKYMKYFLLGLLMLKEMTVYQLKVMIAENFSSMCSDSMGSIQAALKNLLSNGLITYTAVKEKNVEKKYYRIKENGRKEFLMWLQNPMDMSQGKNTELGKLLFMGILPNDKRVELISAVIKNLESELTYLKHILDVNKDIEANKKELLDYYADNPDYAAALLSAGKSENIAQSFSDIHKYEMLTAQHGADLVQFHIKWFKELQKKINAGLF